jgi:hypothetical protein
MAGSVASRAADPANGTLSTATPQLSFVTGPHFDSNAGDCTASPCDDYALSVQLPADYATTHPNAKIRVDLTYSVPGDLDLQLLNSSGAEIENSGEAGPLPEHMEIPAGSGAQTFTVRVVPFAVLGTTATVTIALFNPPAGPPIVNPTGLAPRYQILVSPPDLGADAAEPSIGSNNLSGNAMFISSTQALRMTFGENAAPPQPVACDAQWLDKSGNITTLNTLDPILFTDEVTGRTFNSQLSGANSLFEFTDDDGENWSVGQIAAPNGGADHQTVATGPYPAGLTPAGASWPAVGPKRAVYYCSQSVATAFCSRSDDGGATFGPGFPVKNADCTVGALHGHVKVAPDGTVYVPDSSQCLVPVPGGTAEKVVAFVSNDAGQTWSVSALPLSTGGAASDPSVGIATDGTLYMCYENGDSHVHMAVSHDKGATWVNDKDIGLAAGIVQTRFPQSIAGDPNRASCAFLGTTTSGDGNSLDFEGVWHGYIATTYDGGLSYHLVNVTPNDPVQGYGGVGPDGTNRNLLDFNDLQIDSTGRTLFAFADGCIGGCVRDPSQNPFASKATVVRQVGGRTLFAAFDDDAGTQYNSTTPIKPAAACALESESLRTVAQAKVVWNAPDTGGSPITTYRVLRSWTENGTYAQVGASTNGKTEFIDRTADPAIPIYWYKIVAENAQGAALESNKISLAVSPSPPTVDTCTLPGDLIAIDTIGDGVTDDTDIVYIGVAEPEAYEGNFVITEKLKDFSADQPPPLSFYPILFPGQNNLYISLDATQGAPKFTYGNYTSLPQGVLAFTEVGLLDARSAYAPDGTVRLVVPKSLFTNTTPGSVIAGFDARARLGSQSATSRDTAGPSDYTVRGTAICSQPGIVLATLFAETNAGTPPLSVRFTVTGTPPDGKTLAQYSLSFGDGASLSNQSFNGQPFVSVNHVYQNAGTYRATLTVRDSAGNTSTNLAEQTIEVGTSADAVFDDGFESPTPQRR